ncbi:DUF1127 domain-containing protein [Atopomonas sediminilitoris]|uniref:DUF1127 domain-containing protein n=1 Tax=Atopomonas sediminilitoris TaxID=2919919 RepID=UPI001F4E1725|nr:DUF1127 domain-containing protein [Atopomonas sediminilitoris]MCJ8170489.1 DUF1127 domain-containing protein [Atopomonas sediminilitoris]
MFALSRTQETFSANPASAAQSLSLIGTVLLWQRRLNTRAQLSRLTESQLCDIGLTPMQRQQEVIKPFWR